MTLIDFWSDMFRTSIECRILSWMWAYNGISPAEIQKQMRDSFRKYPEFELLGARPSFHREYLKRMFEGWVHKGLASRTKRFDWKHGKWSSVYTITDLGKFLVLET